MNKVITIGRQFGSGGREFGRRLAEELGFEYYDKEIIVEIAKHTSLSEEYIKQVVECQPHSLYPITIGHSFTYLDDYALKQLQDILNAQNKIICELAEKSSCVIVGRCADFILKAINPYRIFVYADLPSRVKRCIERAPEEEKLDEKQLRKRIKSIDKNRAKYYNFYTGRIWGDKANYDLCINTTDTVIKDIVPAVAKMFVD